MCAGSCINVYMCGYRNLSRKIVILWSTVTGYEENVRD